MSATPLQLWTLDEQPRTSPRSSSASGPPFEPPSARSRRLSDAAKSWNSFATYCRSKSAAIKLQRCSTACCTSTISLAGSGGGGES